MKPNIGDRHNKLVAIGFTFKYTPNYKHHSKITIVIAKCDCGNVTTVHAKHWGNLRVKGCGCELKLPPGEAARNHLYIIYRASAKRRKHEFSLSKDEFISLTSSNCFYCGCSPSRAYNGGKKFTTSYICNGIDRVDNKRGYFLENCVASCWSCNKKKGRSKAVINK
jgi:hypothetical protein